MRFHLATSLPEAGVSSPQHSPRAPTAAATASRGGGSAPGPPRRASPRGEPPPHAAPRIHLSRPAGPPPSASPDTAPTPYIPHPPAAAALHLLRAYLIPVPPFPSPPHTSAPALPPPHPPSRGQRCGLGGATPGRPLLPLLLLLFPLLPPFAGHGPPPCAAEVGSAVQGKERRGKGPSRVALRHSPPPPPPPLPSFAAAALAACQPSRRGPRPAPIRPRAAGRSNMEVGVGQRPGPAER
ncbi:uncharacterized protein LOC128898293 [Dryobates pubescens]|uniref:uncharacterized protein LOC128898293 n=1 Tax=Dryobates pubescens TaxID=118200 RepID=UPI0023B8C3A8|nr:uncharacterized protein LOC128898293 [Dryobates pubescens]